MLRGLVNAASAGIVGVLSVASLTTAAQSQAGIAFRELTVPSERLPLGCSLTASPSIRTADNRVRGGLWLGLPNNPWIGSDPVILASVYERVVDVPAPPDGPPGSSAELAQFRLKLVDDVEEGYAAVYTDGGPYLITVSALRYSPSAQPMRPRSNSLWFASDRVTVAVSGLRSPCWEAVRNHIKELWTR